MALLPSVFTLGCDPSLAANGGNGYGKMFRSFHSRVFQKLPGPMRGTIRTKRPALFSLAAEILARVQIGRTRIEQLLSSLRFCADTEASAMRNKI